MFLGQDHLNGHDSAHLDLDSPSRSSSVNLSPASRACETSKHPPGLCEVCGPGFQRGASISVDSQCKPAEQDSSVCGCASKDMKDMLTTFGPRPSRVKTVLFPGLCPAFTNKKDVNYMQVQM